jgi:Tol biopolymer transport system component
MRVTQTPVRKVLIAVAGVAAFATVGCGERDVKPAVATTPAATGSIASTGSIAYEKEVGADTQLFSARPDGTGERRLTRVDGDAKLPDWSPEGKRIVFHIEHKNAKPHPYCSIAVMNADGSGLIDLAHLRRGCDGGPSFTADRRRIVFGTYDDVKDVEGLATMDLDGGNRRTLKTPWRTGVINPITSPDGKWITFVRTLEEGARNSLFAMRPDGSQLHRVTPTSWGIADKYAWSPDGELLVVTTRAHFVRPGESANVVTIRPDGTIATRITRFKGGEKNAFAGSFSPDGKQIILRLERGDTYSLATVDRDGRNVRAPTRFSTDQPRYIDWGAR